MASSSFVVIFDNNYYHYNEDASLVLDGSFIDLNIWKVKFIRRLTTFRYAA